MKTPTCAYETLNEILSKDFITNKKAGVWQTEAKVVITHNRGPFFFTPYLMLGFIENAKIGEIQYL